MINKLQPWAGIQVTSWTPVLEKTIELGSNYKVVPTEGYIAWEYNPLRNYRLSESIYEKDGKYYTQKEVSKKLTNLSGKEFSFYITETIQTALGLTTDDLDKIITDEQIKSYYGDDTYNELQLYTLREAGELVDFITNELSFDISHPVEILPQHSYDGSVNLILNDGINIPRLINSRFTVTGRNTYKVIDRKGDNDTNIYDQGKQFDVDTSLFKNVNKIPKLEYLGTYSGNMKIGNYHFYFKYSDVDGNESDWVAESGLVSVFMGNTPQSVNTGIRDENSIKSVKFKLSNIDIGYAYVKVYYTRYSADVDSNLVIQAKRIDKNFLVNNSGTCTILITGDENETEITIEEINSSFDVIQNAQTQCSAANRLFMANIHKSKVEYDLLSKLSLCFFPYKYEENYPLSDNGIDENYNISAKSDGYYDSQYIYDKTGYWPGELYRLGVVYILKDGSLSPVFNIRGATGLQNYPENTDNSADYYYSTQQIFKENPEMSITDILSTIDYSEENFMIIGGKALNENAKGVIQLDDKPSKASSTEFPVLGIHIISDDRVITELKNYVKGFFFVRQKRMPLTLAQGIVVGLDKESRTPTLPTLGGIINEGDYDKSFVETEDIKGINFISEGFLNRYYYELKEKEMEGWKKWLLAAAAVIVVAVAVVASVFTCGAAATALGAGLAVALSAGGAAVGASIGVITGVTGGLVAGLGIAAGVQAGVDRARAERNKEEAMAIKGRNEEIPEGYERKELDHSRQLLNDIGQRYIIKDPTKNTSEAIIVPDYQINQPFYNQILTGDTFTIKLLREQPNTNFLSDGYFESRYRHFYVSGYQLQNDTRQYDVRLVGVPDGCPVKMIEDHKYRGRAGYPEESHKYEFQGHSYEDSVNKRDNSDIIRGNFGSYVGMTDYDGHACDQVSIMIPGYKENKLYDYIQLRMQDTSAFYAISDRIDILDINKNTSILAENDQKVQDFKGTYFRGDCYICQYTHRIIRNFNDPSAPYNDIIVDPNSWKDNYDPDKPENYANINLGDVNAVQLGLWLTFQLRSSYNLNIRTIDKSNIDEYLMSGNYRSFYPNYGQLALGAQKLPDSSQYNKGFTKSVSEKYYFEVPDVPYIKQEFQNRIVFSDIHINDAYKNGFRVLRTMNHKDYPITHGSITKLIELQNALLVVFEHGVGLITINNSAEHPSQVLSDIKIINDMYGSQWKDSIIKTPSGIYGVDTVAKKIWKVRNGNMEIISDLKVQEFLNQNITLSERELTPILGIRNVKTVYNAFKHDVMFTFYDNLHGFSEKAWNLCWNEILGIFTTFYSWIPSEMQNIDNIPFSFNRDTVKSISKLGISDHGNDFSDGVTLSNNVLCNVSDTGFEVKSNELHLTYLDQYGVEKEFVFAKNENINDARFIGFLHLDNRTLPKGKAIYKIQYSLLRDRYGNHKLFEIKKQTLKLESEVNELLKSGSTSEVEVWYLALKEGVKPSELLSELYYRNSEGISYADDIKHKKEPIIKRDDEGNITEFTIYQNLPIFKNKAGKRLMLEYSKQINPDKIVRYLNIKAQILISNRGDDFSAVDSYYQQFTNDDFAGMINAGYFESQVAVTTDFNLSLLSTDFWKHGQAGIIDITDKIYPTYWYGRQHPFEFECVIADDPSVHKIFTNLELVANKTKPESFHYEVVGDVYDFSDDKPTMYFRQEALKALYQYNGYDIEYNPNFLEVQPKQHNRSADLPKYYSRWDTVNEIYDTYKQFSLPEGSGFNYDHLAGAEIVYYPTRNEFRVWNHAKAIDIDSLSQDIATSVIKANCRYLEDKWLVSINPIVVTYKNEFKKHDAIADGKSMFYQEDIGVYKYSNWVKSYKDDKVLLPPINITGTKLEQKLGLNIEFPGDYSRAEWESFEESEKQNILDHKTLSQHGKDNALYGLYDLGEWFKGDWRPIDPTKNKDRRETDVRGKFMKVRIRYSGKELAIIDFLNTIYQISYA